MMPWRRKKREVLRISLFGFTVFVWIGLDLFGLVWFVLFCLFVCVDLQGMGTVPYYAIIDTGLTYRGVNPATGWTGERCVLLVTRARETKIWTLTCVKVRRQPVNCKRFHPLFIGISYS